MALLVSIHAPREGCDQGDSVVKVVEKVSIHAPREGCDCFNSRMLLCLTCFNSRTPGGVRLLLHIPQLRTLLVSIHAPREGCDGAEAIYLPLTHVSIHAPREGCDQYFVAGRMLYSVFQFTHPGRGATFVPYD